MESLTLALNNNNTEILAEQESIHNSVTTFNNISLEILDDDSITNILLYFDDIADFKNCKCLNKRICRIIKADAKLQKHAFFLKYCIDPKSFFALSCDYLLSINNKLKQQPKTTAINNENLYINKDSINVKKKLFFAIEKNLAQATAIALKSIKTINHNDGINVFAFSQDNNFIATASNDNITKICHFSNGSWQQLHELNHRNKVQGITFSPDNRHMITSFNLKFIIWEISTKDCKQVATHKKSLGSYIAFRDDSKRLFLNSAFSPIQILDFIDNQWKCIFSVKDSELHKFFNVYQKSFIDNPDLPIEIKKDNKWLSCIFYRYIICSILSRGVDDDYGYKDLATELKNTRNLISGRKISDCGIVDLNACNYNNDMQLMYACAYKSKSSVILKYVNNQWQLKLRVDCSYEEPFSSCFSSDNQRLITIYSHLTKQINEIIIWNIDGDEARKELVLENTHLVQFSQDGKYIITAHCDNQVKIWQFIGGEWKIKSAVKYEHCIDDIFFSNYNWMIAVSSNNSIDILEAMIIRNN